MNEGLVVLGLIIGLGSLVVTYCLQRLKAKRYELVCDLAVSLSDLFFDYCLQTRPYSRRRRPGEVRRRNE